MAIQLEIFVEVYSRFDLSFILQVRHYPGQGNQANEKDKRYRETDEHSGRIAATEHGIPFLLVRR
jgi:hypothetical protein